MIRVNAAKEPLSFNSTVREPGLLAIAEMVGELPPRARGRRFKRIAASRDEIPADRFPSYWTRALDDLMLAYHEICAYSCFRIHRVTGARSVDHLVPKSRAWDLVYEWTNYRLVSARLNSRKNAMRDALDPFDIQDGWFQLELLGFQVVPNANLDSKTMSAVRDTIDRLGLNDYNRERASDAERYWNRDVSLAVLSQDSPFVARELRRQGRLLPGDA